MESQPQNPEFRNISPENFHPCTLFVSVRNSGSASERFMTIKSTRITQHAKS